MDNLTKDFPNTLIFIFTIIGIAWVLNQFMYNRVFPVISGFDGDKQNQTLAEDAGKKESMDENEVDDMEMEMVADEMDGPIEGGEPISMDGSDEGVASLQGTEVEPSAFPSSQLSSDQLLPSDRSSVWANSHPEITGPLAEQDFLSSGFHIGVNTQGSSLRYANRQFRSEPPNPQVQVSPWMQTTITADVNRRPLEIGGDW